MVLEKLDYFFNTKKTWFFSLFSLLVCIDFFSKSYIFNNFDFYQSVEIISFLKFTFVKNYGIAFSFFNDSSLNLNMIFSLLVFMICSYLFYQVFLRPSEMESKIFKNLSFIFILSGGIGNLIDRLIYGYVIDFIDITFNPYVFNLADSYVTIGLLTYLIFSFKKGLNENH